MSCNVQEMSGTVPIVTNDHEVTKLKKKNKNSPRMADDLAAADCLFERLRAHQQRAPDSTEIIKTIVARISARLTSHDKGIRQTTLEKLWNPQTGAMQMLIVILESTRDVTVATYITSILREALCLKQGKGKKNAANDLARQQSVQYLIAIKAPKTFMNILVEMHGKCGGNVGIDHVINNVIWILSAFSSKANNQARTVCAQEFIGIKGTPAVIRKVIATVHDRRAHHGIAEILLQDLLWTLSPLASRDPKFANRMRELGCVRTLHLIMKGHYSDNKIIFPLLTIMKQLAKNPVTTSILVRDGIVTTYERVLNSLGFIPTARLRLCLDAIDYFSKNKVCCMQIVKTGLSNILLRVFDRWDRYEGRMRLKICAHILQTLQHLCNIKSGRRALCTKKHVQILHRFCSNCPDQAEFDGLLARVCSVITLCLMHQSLPVPINSPASFNLNTYLKETNSYWAFQDEDDDLHTSDSKSIVSDAEYDGTETELDIAFPDLDFEDSDTKLEVSAEIEKQRKKNESFQSTLLSAPSERDVEDLKKYFVFFKEFGSYNKQIRLVRSRSNIRGSILDEFMRVNHSPTKGGSLTNVTGVNNMINVANEYENSVLTTTNPLAKISENNCPSSSSSSLKVYKDLSRFSSFSSVYCTIATRVKSVVSFVKVAHPDMMSAQSLKQPEPLNKMERSACRNKLHSCVDRAINPESYLNEVVYDLDQLSSSETKNSSDSCLTNTDEQDISKIVPGFVPTKLAFESRFESGNLRKAIQIGPREYELILMPDVNSTKRHQWFYFEVRNMQMGKPYVFNIVNCEKSDSQFNFGMKPVLYSVKESMHGRGGWIRAGTDICYYRNSYHYPIQKNTNKCYLTVTFNIDFPHSNDVCYLAYHFPYTYSFMMSRIWQWSTVLPSGTYFRIDPLCYTLNNNEVPLITITAEDAPANAISDREIIFLTARVHPGESNASWVMDGTLGSLLDDTAATAKLRAKYIFKIVPMLNPEGVINGCHRCGLTNEDLNRRWSKPNPVMHPPIYHTKGLIEYLVSVWKKPPLVYCDYHGHSRKKNVFFYGCASAESWCPNDRLIQDEPVKYLMLPALMHRISPAFALGSCSFRIERERESTARVTVWRHLGVTRSYTMEASFCGFDRGPFKGLHLNTQHLQNVGSDFCEALNGLGESSNTVDIQLTKDLNGEAVDSEAGSGSDSILNTDSDEDFD